MASVLASAQPAWLNFGQHRRPTYSYNNGSRKRESWWTRFTISIANNKHNTKGHRVIKTKDLNKNWLATWQYHNFFFLGFFRCGRPQCLTCPYISDGLKQYIFKKGQLTWWEICPMSSLTLVKYIPEWCSQYEYFTFRYELISMDATYAH